jgi:hypothetical protein
MFHDIDFLLSRESYLKIIDETRLLDMPNNAYAFFALPGAYLREKFTQRYLELHDAGDGAFADALVHHGIMRKDPLVYEQNTFAISAIVVNRLHLLALGGHDKSFTGHGAEDFELMHRLTTYYMKGPKPQNYYTNTRNNGIQNYEGFRAFYALYGIELFQRGIVISHLWHPRREGSGYTGTSNQNRVSQTMKDFDAGLTSLPPLEDLSSDEHTLVLLQPGTSPARALRHAFPAMGKFRCIPEKAFHDPDSLIKFVKEDRFTRVLFLNPYGNEHRLSLYRATKAAGMRCIAYDRGALNDSWFFDNGGFLGESTSYHRDRWDVPISEDEREATIQYLLRMKLTNETLEKNGNRLGADHLRQVLGVGDRKIIFVALQRPSDTATVHFAFPCGSAEEFNEWVSHLATHIDPRRFAIVVKKHPLETVRPDIPNVTFADDFAHINDLIDLADKVVVINSGTGLLAAAYGTPVICCGNSFYAHDGFAYAAASKEHLLELVSSDLSVDAEVRLRFMKYLIFNFYSFGKTEYLEKKQPDGSMRAIARKVVYSVLRGLTPEQIVYGDRPAGITLESPIFYSYGGRAGVKGTPASSTSRPSAPAPVSRPPAAITLPPAAISSSNTLRHSVVRPFVAKLGSKKDLKEFNKDASQFFATLPKPYHRIIGRIFFPPNR